MVSETTSKQKAEAVAARLGLEAVGRLSFVELCTKGCNPEYLAEYLTFLVPKAESVITPTGNRKPYSINLRALDSYETALGGVEKRDLERLPKQLLKYAEKIEEINLSRLVRYLEDDKYGNDIHAIPRLLVYYANEFIPLLLKQYESLGAQQKPQYTEYLNRMIDHVEQTTGVPHYTLISNVLNELGIEANEESLSSWRYRNKPIEGEEEAT